MNGRPFDKLLSNCGNPLFVPLLPPFRRASACSVFGGFTTPTDILNHFAPVVRCPQTWYWKTIMGFVRPIVCILVLVAVACGQQAPTPDAAPDASSKPATPSFSPSPILTPSPTFTPVPSATLTPAVPARLPIPNATATPTVERIGEIKGHGYAPPDVRYQAWNSDLIARVRHLSVEPSFRINSRADPEERYGATLHFSFSIIETLWGTPPGDVVVVEYSVYGHEPTKAQAIEQAKKSIASLRDARLEWWNKREAIIFLDDLRFAGGKLSEISTGAHYSFANHIGCPSHSSCLNWRIGYNDSYPNWVWLPIVEQDASLEVPDSERMFRVVVDSYDTYESRVASASLAEIKAILKAYRSEEGWHWRHVERYRPLWEAKGSDSYSFVYSAVIVYTWDVHHYERTFFPAQKIFVRNGEVVEVFFVEDVDLGDEVWPAGSRIELDKIDGPFSNLPTIETFFWHYAESSAGVSFDYEFGYPTTVTLDFGDGVVISFYASDYTPLDK